MKLTRFESLLKTCQIGCRSTHTIDAHFKSTTFFNFKNAWGDYKWNVSFFTPEKNVFPVNLWTLIFPKSCTHFKTCWNLTPNNGPGFVVGTRSSSLENLTVTFKVMASESFNDFGIGVPSNQFRLNCRKKIVNWVKCTKVIGLT